MGKQSAAVWTRRRRTGFIVLLLFLTLLLFVWRVLPRIVPAPRLSLEDDYSVWQNFKEENQFIFVSDEDKPQSIFSDTGGVDGAAGTLFEFDPNTITESGLVELGIPVSVARTIVKYRNKGGRFYKPEDLRKIYTLSEEDYKRVAPYAVIPGEKAPQQKRRQEAEIPPIDLNAADAETLMTLKGIGVVYSNRIVKYRNLLGGFVAVGQLKEVYGFPDSTYEMLKEKFVVDGSQVKKMNLNTASGQVLARHPYIDKAMAKRIIQARDSMGQFSEISQLRQVPLISEEKYRKIAPYLSL